MVAGGSVSSCRDALRRPAGPSPAARGARRAPGRFRSPGESGVDGRHRLDRPLEEVAEEFGPAHGPLHLPGVDLEGDLDGEADRGAAGRGRQRRGPRAPNLLHGVAPGRGARSTASSSGRAGSRTLRWERPSRAGRPWEEGWSSCRPSRSPTLPAIPSKRWASPSVRRARAAVRAANSSTRPVSWPHAGRTLRHHRGVVPPGGRPLEPFGDPVEHLPMAAAVRVSSSRARLARSRRASYGRRAAFVAFGSSPNARRPRSHGSGSRGRASTSSPSNRTASAYRGGVGGFAAATPPGGGGPGPR